MPGIGDWAAHWTLGMSVGLVDKFHNCKMEAHTPDLVHPTAAVHNPAR